MPPSHWPLEPRSISRSPVLTRSPLPKVSPRKSTTPELGNFTRIVTPIKANRTGKPLRAEKECRLENHNLTSPGSIGGRPRILCISKEKSLTALLTPIYQASGAQAQLEPTSSAKDLVEQEPSICVDGPIVVEALITPQTRDGDRAATRLMEVMSSEADVYEDASEDWTRTKGNKAEETNNRSKGNMTNLLYGIDNLVEKEKWAESSSEEDIRHCAHEVRELKLLIHSYSNGSRKATVSLERVSI